MLVVVLLSANTKAQAVDSHIRPSDPVAAAIDYLGDLEYEHAIQQLRSWLKTHPEDLRALNCLATSLLYQEMFHRGLLESRVYGNSGDIFKASRVPLTPQFEQQLLPILEKAQTLAEMRAEVDPKDKVSLYWAGVTHGTRATFDLALRKEYVTALHESTEALDLHRRVLELDPQYVDAYLIVGMNNYILGSLPWYVRVVAALTGRRGDRDEGIRQVKRVTEEGTDARGDARLMLAVLYQREKMYREALQMYEKMSYDHPRNYLLLLEIASLYSSLNQWSRAAEVYDTVLERHRTGQPGYSQIPLARILYTSGEAHERSDQPEEALSRYSEAGAIGGGDRGTYMAQLKAGGILLRLHRNDEARNCYLRVAEGTPGSEEGKAARQALRQIPSTN